MLKSIRALFVCLSLFIIIGMTYTLSNNPFATKNKNELNIFVYSELFNLESIEQFTNDTGIKVNIHIFNTNEELLTRLKIAKEDQYDLLICTDYASKILYDQGKLARLDKSKLPFTKRIYPFLLNRDFDPNNDFSYPYIWEAYGIAYNPTIINNDQLSLKDLFSSSHKIVMTSDPLEMTLIGSHHLFGDKENLSHEEQSKLVSLLKEQKNNVEAYADFRTKDIVSSDNASIALIKTCYIDDLKRDNKEIEFTLPKDKIFLCVENAVIWKQSKNKNAAYKFLNHIYDAKNLSSTIDQFPCYPACSDAFNYGEKHHEVFMSTIDEISKREKDYRFFKYDLDKDSVRKIFIEAKA